MCAKYSDFLCIWLRKCDFLSGKVRYWPDPDPQHWIPVYIYPQFMTLPRSLTFSNLSCWCLGG